MGDIYSVHIIASYMLTDTGFKVTTAMDGFIERVIMTEVDLTEKGIIEALKALGWTPPEEKESKE